MMRGIGLLLFVAIGVGLAWIATRPTRVASVTLPGFKADVTDQAIEAQITSGNAWYQYWKHALNGVYQSVGNMPIDGPLVTCITSPCPGTPIPQSP